jgi:hypothetical protein
MKVPFRFELSALIPALLIVSSIACKKSGDGKNSAADGQSNNSPGRETTDPNGSGEGPDENNVDPQNEIATGTLAVIDFAVAPVAAQGEFLTMQTSANASSATVAGSLAVGAAALKVRGDDAAQDSLLLAAVPESNYWMPSVASSMIASGAPDEMEIYVKSITLKHKAAGDDLPGEILFESDQPRAIKLANGTADLSPLVAGSTGGTASFSVKPGTYDTIRVNYMSKGKIKGCVNMLYRCGTGSGNDCSQLSTADIPGNADATGIDPTHHLYCTQANNSPYAASKAQNSDFENATPELMDFPIAMAGQGFPGNGDESFPIDYSLPEEVTVAADAAPLRLTLAIDLNRMLRYYNRGRQDQAPNPGMPTDEAYFFTTVFSNSGFVFLGEPGRIYGYEMLAKVCTNNATYDANSQTCSDNQAFQSFVPFWMTLITAADGAPISALMMPDDDNALTITKGTVTDYARCPADQNSQWVRTTSPTKAEIYYALCNNNADSEPAGTWGKLANFPASLEGYPALPIDEAASSGNVPGVLIHSHQVDTQNGNSQNLYEGIVEVTRRL